MICAVHGAGERDDDRRKLLRVMEQQDLFDINFPASSHNKSQLEGRAVLGWEIRDAWVDKVEYRTNDLCGQAAGVCGL